MPKSTLRLKLRTHYFSRCECFLGGTSKHICYLFWLPLLILFSSCSGIELFPESQSGIRTAEYFGLELPIGMVPEEPTLVIFPGNIATENFPRTNLGKTVDGEILTLFSWDSIPPEGEYMSITLEDRRTFQIVIVPATSKRPKDVSVKIIDRRLF